MQFRGHYKMTFGMDVSFETSLKVTIAKLLHYTAPPELIFLGEVPLVYDPFMVMDLGVTTQPVAFSAGFTVDLYQTFTMKYIYDAHWNSCVKKNYWITDHCHATCQDACTSSADWCEGRVSSSGCFPGLSTYKCYSCDGAWEETTNHEQSLGQLQKTVKPILSVGGDTEGDGCPDALQHFGFTITPSIKVGAVFYDLMGLYIRPEVELPVHLIMPQSDGPTCGQSSAYNMCSASDPKKASWSVDGTLRFYLGIHINSLNDILQLLLTDFKFKKPAVMGKVGEALISQGVTQEKKIGGDISLGQLAKSCFALPDVLDKFYTKVCCSEPRPSPNPSPSGMWCHFDV